MAISNYSELQTEMASWLHRDDLTAKLPDFIQMGEDVLNRKLRTVDMETRATTAMDTTSRFMALPTGFIEMRSMVIQDPAQEILYLAPRKLREYVSSETDTGTPTHFTIKDEIEFDVIPDSAYALEQHYLKGYDLATDTANWLLTNHPELYLHACLAPAALFARDSDLYSTMAGLRDQGIAEVNRLEARKRGGMAYLRVDDALSRSNTYSIITGQ